MKFTRRLALVAVLLAPQAQAHETVNAGNVSLEWHTDTNELLQTNSDTTLSLTLRVKNRPVKLTECRCTLLLYLGDVSPRTRPALLKLVQAQDGSLQTVMTLTRSGDYSLVLDAKPLDITTFSAFRTVIKLKAVDDVYNVPKEP